ncbi:hypothetical protein RB595_009441 [Gaeumannomyces hyphopodioides]
MAGFTGKKRSRDEKLRLPKGRPAKKPRKQREYHSSSEDGEGPEDGQDFTAVNLLDSDAEDLDNMDVDDGESSGPDDSSSDEEGSSREDPRVRSKARKPAKTQATKKAQTRKTKSGEGDGSEGDSDGSNNNNGSQDDSEDDSDSDGEGTAPQAGGGRGKKQSKRNDPAAFATSMSKILSTKLSSSRRADPVLARSAEAHEAARLAVDSGLEAKAHRKMAEQRRLALEKGRVRDVLVATNTNSVDGGGKEEERYGERRQATTSEMLEAEKRLRKVAQRGVIKLFNAVRAAQVKAADAQRAVRAEGVVGMNRREEKVTEMTKKGFLDLIAAGGGGLKKGPLEEA